MLTRSLTKFIIVLLVSIMVFLGGKNL